MEGARKRFLLAPNTARATVTPGGLQEFLERIENGHKVFRQTDSRTRAAAPSD